MLINNSLLIKFFIKYAEKISFNQDEFENAKIITTTALTNVSEFPEEVVKVFPKIFREFFLKTFPKDSRALKTIIGDVTRNLPDNLYFIINPNDVFTVVYPYRDKGDLNKPKTKQSIFKFLNEKIRENLKKADHYPALQKLEGAEIKKEERDGTIRYFTYNAFVEALINSIGNVLANEATNLFNQEDVIDKSSYREFVGKDVTEEYVDMDSRSHSCMTGQCAKSLIKLYENNPDKIKLIRYLGVRFLIWKCDDGQFVLDRIYPDNHKLVSIIVSWAKKNNILTKENPTSLDETKTFSDGSVRFVTMLIDKLEELPYLDTFSFGKFDFEKNQVTLTNKKTDEYNLDFSSLSVGAFEEGDKKYDSIGSYLKVKQNVETPVCEYCYKHAREVHKAKFEGKPLEICNSCMYTYFYKCEICNILCEENDKHTFADPKDKSTKSFCNNCFDENFVTCSQSGCNTSEPKATAKKLDGEIFCDDCYDNISTRCSYCSEIINSENCEYDEDGNYCKECFADKQKENNEDFK